jgi:hypothetical protein
MGFERRSTWVAAALAATLVMAAASAGGGEPAESCGTQGSETSPCGLVSEGLVRHDTTYERDSDGCAVTLHESRYQDGSRRSVKRTICDDGAARTLERHFDAQGRLAYAREHEITADGVVRLVEHSDEGAVAAAGAEEGGSMLPDVAARGADRERIRDWLDAKFEEWGADAEAQIEVQETTHGRPQEPGEQ